MEAVELQNTQVILVPALSVVRWVIGLGKHFSAFILVS